MDLPAQGLSTAVGHIDLAPEAGDELLLLGCPVHHGVGRKGSVWLPAGMEEVLALAPGGIARW